jgi:hypothetical protein
MPNLNDETKRQISKDVSKKGSKASAWPAWIGIFDAMNDQIVRGRTAATREAAERGIVGVGLHAIARAVGVDVKTIRRQVGRLEDLGLVATRRPLRMVVIDPATGRIKSKSAGRTPPCMVYVTITEKHLRPFKRRLRGNTPLNEKPQGAICPPSTQAVKGQYAPPSKDCSKELLRHRRQAGRTYGAGRPADRREGGIAATYQPDYRPATGWVGEDAERAAATQRRLAAEAAAREAEDAARRAERERQASTAATIKKVEGELVEAILKLPPETQKEVRRRGRKTKRRLDAKAAKKEPTPAASEKASKEDKEAAALDALITSRRQAMAGDRKGRYRRQHREERELVGAS